MYLDTDRKKETAPPKRTYIAGQIGAFWGQYVRRSASSLKSLSQLALF